MGTNFYLKRRDKETLHIGKSSAGWCFSLHVFEDCGGSFEMEGPGSLEEWVRLFKEYPEGIEDQYGMHVTPTEMMTKITERSWGCDSRQIPRGYSSWEDFYRANSAEEGPQGLLRHRIDGKHCVGHGSGTWDLIAGEFS